MVLRDSEAEKFLLGHLLQIAFILFPFWIESPYNACSITSYHITSLYMFQRPDREFVTCFSYQNFNANVYLRRSIKLNGNKKFHVCKTNFIYLLVFV